MDIQLIASFAVITADPTADRALFVDAMGLPLHGPESVEGSDYVFSDAIPGAKHFGVWPLSEAAESCFGTSTWPDTHPVPQASVEFEVGTAEEVDGAVEELQGGGHRWCTAAGPSPGARSSRDCSRAAACSSGCASRPGTTRRRRADRARRAGDLSA